MFFETLNAGVDEDFNDGAVSGDSTPAKGMTWITQIARCRIAVGCPQMTTDPLVPVTYVVSTQIQSSMANAPTKITIASNSITRSARLGYVESTCGMLPMQNMRSR